MLGMAGGAMGMMGGIPGMGMGGMGMGGFGGGGHNTGPGNERAPLQEGNSLVCVPEEVRRGFVTKVYGILSAQLLLTTLVSGAVVYQGPTMTKTHPNLAMALIFGSTVTTFSMMFVFMCCPDTMRKAPLNYLLLLLFTCGKGVVVGIICVQYSKESVLVAVAITSLVVVALTIFACCTSMDFTGYAPYMGCAMMVLCGFGFFMMLASMMGLGNTPAFQMMPMVYAAIGAMIFSVYLVFDTQLILGGRHYKFEFCIDDYAMAAISIYVDIIELFVFILQLVGKREGPRP